MATEQEIQRLKTASVGQDAHPLIGSRWSPRAFSDKPVAAGTLESLFNSARWAASSMNEQPWRFLVGRKGDATWQKIYDSLVEGNKSWAKNAPVLMLSVGRKSFTRGGSPNPFSLHDTGAATAFLALQATHLGLHTHSMGGYDQAKARAAFGIPEDYDMGAVTAIGYFGGLDSLDDSLREREAAPRTRKPLKEFVFGEWNEPAPFLSGQ